VVKVAIANFGEPIVSPRERDPEAHARPPRRAPAPLFEGPADWGFHIYALGAYLMDRGIADEVEFWDYAETRSASYHSTGILRVLFHDPDDVEAHLRRDGYPDLFVNHGPRGQPVLDLLEGKTFRVHVPALRMGRDRRGNVGAECYLVDSEEFLDDRSMLYVPVVNTRLFRPAAREKKRDFIYLASVYRGKRHDILLNAARHHDLSGHLHPVDPSQLDLTGTRITTSRWNEADVLELLHTSRIAVYPGDRTSSPAAMWECVAAGLPIVVNRDIDGGAHLVVSGVTGELAPEEEFGEVMRFVLERRDTYRPRAYFEEQWDTLAVLDSYVRFFRRMGWRAAPAASAAEPPVPSSARASGGA
jgi:glycosyltransferase involved in cell wall biosynthesis